MERLRVQIIVDIVYRLRAGQSVRAICRDLGHSRKTIRRYRKLAWAKGYLDLSRPLPEPAEVLAELGPVCSPPSSNVSSVEPYRELVKGMVEQGVEMVAIHLRLVRHHGYSGSYSSVRRFVHHLRPRRKEVVVRLESPPGQCAQVDFGGAGKMRDPASGRLRQAYCFVMTLAYSRHQYVEFVFDQKMETWIGCHQRAFEIWPTWVLVAIDHFSRAVMAVVPLEGPNAGWIVDAMEAAFLRHGPPKHLISDQEGVFMGELFPQLLRDWNVKRRFGAVGKHGSIAVTERLIWTLKREWLARVVLIRGLGHLGQLLADFEEYYNECRCHQRLVGETPSMVYEERNWQKPDRCAKQLAGQIRLRHFREPRITVYELAA